MRREKATLDPCHLVLVELHGVDGPAAIGVVLGKGSEYTGQQDFGLGALGMDGIWCLHFLSP